MIKRIIFGLIVFVSCLLAFPYLAQASDCSEALAKLQRHGPRGFIGVVKPQQHFVGLMPWGSRIYTVDSIDQILPHHNLEKNMGNHHFYAVTKYRVSDELHDLYDTKDAAQRAKAQELVAGDFKKVVSESKIYWVQDGKVVQVPDEFVKANFLPEKMEVTKQIERGPVQTNPSGTVALGENAFYVRGYFLPPWRGVIMMEDALASLKKRGSTYRDISLRLARQIEQGYTITFNSKSEKDFAEILEYLGAQERTIKHLEHDIRVPVTRSANRFRDQATRDKMMIEFKEGRAIGLTKRDPEGKLLSVSIINKEGNNYEPDTVGYLNIEDAKDLVFVITDVLGSHGFIYMDGAMATNFTQAMKGKYISYEAFAKLTETVPKEEIAIDWNFQWKGPKFLVRPLQN